MPDIVKVSVDSVCAPFLNDIKPMPEDLYAEMLKKIGATQASLDRDVKLLREWLAQQPHLPQLGEEYDPWLSRFLIGAKNSLQNAKNYLEHYFSTRSSRPHMFTQELSAAAAEMFRLIKSGVLPTVTPKGTRMLISKYTKELGDNASKMDWGLYYRLTVHLADLFLASAGHPVEAEVCIDLENFTVGLSNSFIANLSDFKIFIDTIQGAIPLRYVAVHLLNAPGIIKTVIAMVKPFLKDKLGERIIVHDDYASFHKCVYKEGLPTEYGGSCGKTLAEMCDDWYLVIHTNMPWLLARQKVLVSDESKRVGGKLKQDDFGVEGSFRKLAVD